MNGVCPCSATGRMRQLSLLESLPTARLSSGLRYLWWVFRFKFVFKIIWILRSSIVRGGAFLKFRDLGGVYGSTPPEGSGLGAGGWGQAVWVFAGGSFRIFYTFFFKFFQKCTFFVHFCILGHFFGFFQSMFFLFVGFYRDSPSLSHFWPFLKLFFCGSWYLRELLNWQFQHNSIQLSYIWC